MVGVSFTFFLPLLAGAISALIGVYLQVWHSKRETQKKLIDALKNELQLNQRRIGENILHLYRVKIGKAKEAVLVSSFLVRVYEVMLIEDPTLFFELSSKTNGLLDIVYTELVLYNAWFNAMAFRLTIFEGVDSAISELEKLNENIEKVLKALEED